MKDKTMEWIAIIAILIFAAALLYQALTINHLGRQMEKYFFEVERK